MKSANEEPRISSTNAQVGAAAKPLDVPRLVVCGRESANALLGFVVTLGVFALFLFLVGNNLRTKTTQNQILAAYQKIGELESRNLVEGETPSEWSLDPAGVMERNQVAARKAFWRSFLPDSKESILHSHQ